MYSKVLQNACNTFCKGEELEIYTYYNSRVRLIVYVILFVLLNGTC